MLFSPKLDLMFVAADSGGTQKEDLEDLPKQFHLLVQDVDFFLQCLNDFSEFKDEALNDAILVFKKEVKVSILLIFSEQMILIDNQVPFNLYERI